MKKQNVELRKFNGETHCTSLVCVEFPAIIVLDELGSALRGFYKVGTREKGKLGIYQECDTQKV